MLDSRKRTQIKNNKLASFSYTITYRPGKDNVGPDTLTRAFCASATSTPNKLSEIYDQLCHPGVTRLLYIVRAKNLPHSTDDMKRLCASCEVCSELKPQFYRAETGTLIKATQPMERLSIDFKGPLKSNIILHKMESLASKQHHTTKSEMANVNGTTVSSGKEFNSH